MVFGRITLVPVLLYLAFASFVKAKNNDLAVHVTAQYIFASAAFALLALLLAIRAVRRKPSYLLEAVLREYRRRKALSQPRPSMPTIVRVIIWWRTNRDRFVLAGQALAMVAAIMIPVIYVIFSLVTGK